MHEFMLNIDNKEILNEILHHSVDYMIESSRNPQILHLLEKSSHKYGFANPEEFESAIKIIANAYRMYCLNSLTDAELLGHFSHMNQDLQQSVVDVATARKPEIMTFLLREYNSRDNKLLESFDWDVRFVMGNSSLASHRSQLSTIVFNCTEGKGEKSTLHFEVDKAKLEEMIRVLEKCEKELNVHEVDSKQIAA